MDASGNSRVSFCSSHPPGLPGSVGPDGRLCGLAIGRIGPIGPILLVAIIAISALVRLAELGNVPPPLFRDEAEKGYNAYSLLKTARDYEGCRLPLFINVFATHTSAIYQYASLPWVGLFGLKVWTTRLTAALVGIITVFFVYLLARQLLDQPTALVIAALLAFSPWHICFSRWAQQGIFMPLLFTIAAWATARFRHGWRMGTLVAAASIGLAAYAYDVGRVLAPLFLILLVASARSQLREHWRWAIASALVLGIFLVPTVWFIMHQPEAAMARFRRISIAQSGMTPLEVAAQFFINYARHFSPIYLGFSGDPELRHSPHLLIGELYPIELPFLLAGLYFLAKRSGQAAAIIIGWMLISPVASSMTREGVPHALRSLAGVPAFAMAIGVGLVETARRLKTGTRFWAIATVALTELACVACFLTGYFATYPRISGHAWQSGIGEALAYCHKEVIPGSEVWLTEAVGGMSLPAEIISPTEIFVSFYEQIPPEQFQQNRLNSTRFRVLPSAIPPGFLLTERKGVAMFLIALVGESPPGQIVTVFGGSKSRPDVAVGVYRL